MVVLNRIFKLLREERVSNFENEVRIVVCNRQISETPENCTTCNLAADGCPVVKITDKFMANSLASKYLKRNKDVLVRDCRCEYKNLETRTSPQLNVTIKDVHHSGGKYEDDDLRKRRECSFAG